MEQASRRIKCCGAVVRVLKVHACIVAVVAMVSEFGCCCDKTRKVFWKFKFLGKNFNSNMTRI